MIPRTRNLRERFRRVGWELDGAFGTYCRDGDDKMASTTCGQCRLCGGTFGKAQITRHIKICLAKKGHGSHLLLLVQDRSRRYWVFVTVAKSVNLLSLDRMLRDLWLECCGHMSTFSDGTVSYVNGSGPRGLGDGLRMDVLIEQAMQTTKTLKYEYDFGSTTELTIRMVGEKMAGENDIEILSRNNPPQFNCQVCGKPAIALNIENWAPEPYCKSCWPSEEGEMEIPLINSPRMGVCDYEGPSIEPRKRLGRRIRSADW